MRIAIVSIVAAVVLALGGCLLSPIEEEFLTPPPWILGAWAPEHHAPQPTFQFTSTGVEGLLDDEWVSFQVIIEDGRLIEEIRTESSYSVEFERNSEVETVCFSKRSLDTLSFDRITTGGSTTTTLVPWLGPVSIPCEYFETHGIATITSIGPPEEPATAIWELGLEVRFDFMPFSPIAEMDYVNPDYPDTGRRLVASCHRDPLPEWLESDGIRVGTRLRCTRYELLDETCDSVHSGPVTFRFPELCSGWSGY